MGTDNWWSVNDQDAAIRLSFFVETLGGEGLGVGDCDFGYLGFRERYFAGEEVKKKEVGGWNKKMETYLHMIDGFCVMEVRCAISDVDCDRD